MEEIKEKKTEIKPYQMTGDLNDKQNGFEFAKLNGYTIYQFTNTDANKYFLAVPDEYVGTYQIFVGFPQRDLRNASRDEIISEINGIREMISAINRDGIYVLPDIPLEELENAANKDDFSLLLKKVQAIISDCYLRLKNFNNSKDTIDQLIRFVKQSETDSKFIMWLEINFPNFTKGISYDEIKKYYYARVSQDRDMNKDLEETKIIPREMLFQDQNKANDADENYNQQVMNQFGDNNLEGAGQSQGKSRILSNPNVHYDKPEGVTTPPLSKAGFGNILILISIFGIIAGIGMILGKLLIK